MEGISEHPKQTDRELFHEYWDRFKRLIASCPHHGLADANLVQYFYEGLTHIDRLMVDTSSGGALMNKTAAEAKTMLEGMATNSQQFGTRREAPTASVNEVGHSSHLEQQIAALTSLVQQALVPLSMVCVVCSMVGHASETCPSVLEQANAMGGYQRPQYGNQPVRQWGAYANPQVGQSYYTQPPMIQGQRETGVDPIPQLEANLTSYIKLNDKRMDAIQQQMEHMIQLLSQREPSRLPSQTEVNHKATHHEQVNAVSLRNGRPLEEVPKGPKKSKEAVVDGENSWNASGNEEGKRPKTKRTQNVVRPINQLSTTGRLETVRQIHPDGLMESGRLGAFPKIQHQSLWV